MLVPHPRYLIDYAPLSASFAGALMCSGLTAYAALKRLADRAAARAAAAGRHGRRRHDGAGARARPVPHAPIVADIDREKARGGARRRRAAAFDPADPGARKAVLKASGGVYAAVDFVGSDKSLNFATGALAKGGKVVVTGLIGGTYSTAVAMFPLKAMSIEGTQTGTLAEARELIELVRARTSPPPPIAERPLGAGAGKPRRPARRPHGRARGADGVAFYVASFFRSASRRSRKGSRSGSATRLSRSAVRIARSRSEALVEIVVDQDVIVFAPVRDFLDGVLQPLRDDSRLSSARRSSRAFNSSADGGSTNTLTMSFAHLVEQLLRALPVDVEQHVAAGGERRFHRLARRAVIIAVHLRPFEQIAAVAHRSRTGVSSMK